MDKKTVEANIRLYDSHATVRNQSAQQVRNARESGDAFPLKKFHNSIKLELLKEFARNADSLLDMCCGRGGDIHKWINCNIRKVIGLDISTKEIVEAFRRYREAKKKRPGSALEAKFNHCEVLGTKELKWESKFDVVTCMFAIHYFFVSEPAIKTFFKNVQAALKPGGYFIATFPSGKKVLQTLNQQEEHRSPMLYLKKGWKGKDPTKPFGQAFECAISNTVTRAETSEDIVGSHEYLVFFNVIEALAKQVGLKLVKRYRCDDLNELFQDADMDSGFKHFKPPFGNEAGERNPGTLSLRVASELYVATVFQMTAEARQDPVDPKRERQGDQGDDQGGQGKKQKV